MKKKVIQTGTRTTDPWSKSLAILVMSQNITITTELSKLFNRFAFASLYNFQVLKSSTDAYNGYFRAW